MTLRRSGRLLAAALLAAAAGVALPVPAAQAATCATDTGVSVVVDFSKLGGSVAATCVADGGGESAASSLEVDHDLTRVQQFPGAVCRVDDTPADAQCRTMPPTDAYWGLFWSDGSGGWVYSSEGVDSLEIPDGGSVAFAWQDGGDRDYPGVAAPQHAEEEPSPTPSASPTGGPGGGSGGSSGSGGGSGSAGGQPTSTAPTSTPTTGASATEGAGAGDSGGEDDRDGKGGKGGKGGQDAKGGKGDGKGDQPSEDPSAAGEQDAPEDDPAAAVPAATAPDATDDGLPVWVAPAGIALLFAAAGGVALIRRRQAG